MDIDSIKKAIKDNIRQVSAKKCVRDNSKQYKKLMELESDIANNQYTIVVVGEFKRGKSTFINALLGDSLLPMDILPETATINAVSYSDSPVLTVVHNDGHEEIGEPTYDYLKQFSARQKVDKASDVKYIKLGYPLEMLKNNVVLVDTPGVSDINEQRSEVTYGFIPKANAVIFLLDSRSPLKRTEKEFIEEKLLKLGVNNIMFIANNYDAVDDDEEEDFLDDLHQRLMNAFKMDSKEAMLREISLYPLSALYALNGILKGDDKLIAFSGINEIKARLNEMLFNGKVEQEKVDSYRKRLLLLLKSIEDDMQGLRALRSADKQELEQLSKNLREMRVRAENNKEKVAQYVDDSKEKMYSMADKSIAFFNDKLQEEISDMITTYHGTGFKEYVELSVAKRIKNNYESWTAMYSGHIDTLLRKLESELATGLSYHFRRKIQLGASAGRELRFDKVMPTITAEDISGVNVKAGAVAALGSVGLLAIVGGSVLPLVSFAALPYLRDKMLKEQLAAAKASVLPDVSSQMAEFSFELKHAVHNYIDERCKTICQNTEYAYDLVLNEVVSKIDAELAAKDTEGAGIQADIGHIDDDIKSICAIMSNISKLEG